MWRGHPSIERSFNPPAPPRVGMVATVRNRRGAVSSVAPFDTPEGVLHLVDVEYHDAESPLQESLVCDQVSSRGCSSRQGTKRRGRESVPLPLVPPPASQRCSNPDPRSSTQREATPYIHLRAASSVIAPKWRQEPAFRPGHIWVRRSPRTRVDGGGRARPAPSPGVLRTGGGMARGKNSSNVVTEVGCGADFGKLQETENGTNGSNLEIRGVTNSSTRFKISFQSRDAIAA